MAFWDDIQKGISSAAAYTVQKTSEITDIAKVKYNAKVTEGKLEKCFAEVGRLFYDTQKTGTEHTSEIATLIMQADKLSSDLDALKADLAKIKNTSVCDTCGAEVSKECTFCPVCGAKLVEECTKDSECDCDGNGCCNDEESDAE